MKCIALQPLAGGNTIIYRGQYIAFPFLFLRRKTKNKFRKEENQTKTCVIYARYSSDRQTEQSIEGQLRDCREYAQRNDIAIVGTYIDRAMTGTNDNREQFQQMLKDSDKNLSITCSSTS